MHPVNKIGSSLLSLAAAAAFGMAPVAALAQQATVLPSSSAEAQSAPAGSQGTTGDSTAAFKSADERMMKDMQGSTYTGHADEDFVSHMIPHHQGAVDMAEVELRYGKDPQLKRLAKQIISSQKKEIAFMKQWQTKHGNR